MIGLAKEGTLHARRQALGFIYDPELVKSLFEQVRKDPDGLELLIGQVVSSCWLASTTPSSSRACSSRCVGFDVAGGPTFALQCRHVQQPLLVAFSCELKRCRVLFTLFVAALAHAAAPCHSRQPLP